MAPGERRMPDLAEFFGPNAAYAQELLSLYLEDPSGVNPQTRAYFDSLPRETLEEIEGGAGIPAAVAPGVRRPGAERDRTEFVNKVVVAARVARMVRELGHLGSRIDPLGTP